ncbi:MAG: sugar phosphate isomerase/epimerase family protein [Spirochaetota bacterium]
MFTYGVELLLWTGTFEKKDLHLIEHARKLGFDGVEIHLQHPDRIPAGEIREALAAHGMQAAFIVILDLERNPLSPDPATRSRSLDYLKNCIDAAHQIAGEGCLVGGVTYTAAGYLSGRARTREEWERAVDSFRQTARHAGERGITLAVEPLNRFETFFLNTAADAVRFCREVGEPNVKVHLDTYHMIREETSFYRAIVDTGPFLGYFHACENDRGTPGTGLVRWEEVYRGLKDAGYEGWIVIESFVPDIPELARVAAVWRRLAPSADHLAGEGLRNLRAVERGVLGTQHA